MGPRGLRATTLLLLVLLLLMVLLALATITVHHHASTANVEGGREARGGAVGSAAWARVVVLVDNNPDPEGRLKSAWGVSMLVEAPSARVLFDTGPDPSVLEYNARLLGVDPCNVTAVVVSHEHLDHAGGLAYIARHCPDKPVYIPAASQTLLDYARSLGLKRIVLVNKTTRIAEGVAVLKPLYGPPWEEALAVNVTGKGLVLLVGCSHPGIARIAGEAREQLHTQIHLVIGGFHMAWAPPSKCRETIEKLLSMGVKYIAPIHCSGDTIRSILAREHPEHYIEAHVGTTICVGECRS